MISKVQIKKTSNMHELRRRARPDAANVWCKSAGAQQLTSLQMSRRAKATRQSRFFSLQTRGWGPDRQPLEPP